MSVQAVRQILADDAAVSALAGDRIAPLERKNFEYPAIVLDARLEPMNMLRDPADRDNVTVVVAYWDTTYAGAHTLADAGRSALQGGGMLITNEEDSFEQLASLAGLVCVTQTVEFVS